LAQVALSSKTCVGSGYGSESAQHIDKILSSSDHSKISITAKLVAFLRQFTDIPYAKEVAEFIGAEQAFQSLLQEMDLPSGEVLEFAPILEARYKSIVSLIQKSGINQILELASGFSLRGLAMTVANPAIAYVESDLPDLTAEKIKLITLLKDQRSITQQGDHHVVSANALDLDALDKAVAPLSRDQRLVVVNEGLIQYFSIEERDMLAKNVRELLHKFGGGIWITPDFTSKTDLQNVSEKRQRFRQAVTGITARTLYAGAFENYEQMDQFFCQFGFQSARHNQVDETPDFSSIEVLNLSPEIINKMRSALKIWVLSTES